MTVQTVFTPPAVVQQSTDAIATIQAAVERIRPLVERFRLWQHDPLNGALTAARAILAHPLATATAVAPNRSDTASGTLAAVSDFAKKAAQAADGLERAITAYDQAEAAQKVQAEQKRDVQAVAYQAIADQVAALVDPAPAEALEAGKERWAANQRNFAAASQALVDHQVALATAKNVPAHVARTRQIEGERDAYGILCDQDARSIAPLEAAARQALVAGWDRFEREWQQAATKRLAEPQEKVDALRAELDAAQAERNQVRDTDQAAMQQIAAARQALLG